MTTSRRALSVQYRTVIDNCPLPAMGSRDGLAYDCSIMSKQSCKPLSHTNDCVLLIYRTQTTCHQSVKHMQQDQPRLEAAEASKDIDLIMVIHKTKY